ncbi:DBIRD complex subunit ZNF326 [Myripristis murdjan]|uniref:DBIRD complex subunit ZNF326 n=1 Tax=Myripristis murdjan TaxID=586833 RepID=A0A668AS74_9TELE|nr:DBIRD complex subunit ZNF326 [Myripristis murdjan]
MNRPNIVPFSSPGIANLVYQQKQTGRAPQEYREGMVYTPMRAAIISSQSSSTGNKAPIKQPASHETAAQPATSKWKSTFKPAGEPSPEEKRANSQDKSASSSEKSELYDPYDPVSSESEPEMPPSQEDKHSRSEQGNDRGHRGYKRSSPSRGCRDNHWDLSYSEPGNRLCDGRDFSPESRANDCRSLSPNNRLPERRSYSPKTEALDRPGYGSVNRPLDHRGFSPDRLSLGSTRLMPASGRSTLFPASYGGQRTSGEDRMTVPEYRGERATTVRLSPPRVQVDYQHLLGYAGKGVNQISPSTEVTRNKSTSLMREIEKSPFTCDLCDVEVAKMQELEDHLESKSHWDILEHVQQQNNCDDLTIAFLQEVMLFKVRQCSQAIEESAIEALRENDHMTKVEMFHCAACKVYVSTSVSSVQKHLSSQEHLCNKKEFELWQRRASLAKAETMMKELKPQFEHFLEGRDPFE